ncbi:Rad9-domain-containing protein [Russula earlei]|uniref:Rad9-domain-containing protein n=1 Tax=Russula earlei TaxID=71964 RepID=A0ACC0U722_9AGAM|nr:Rad9-domain-containing protein [Russula earlei]
MQASLDSSGLKSFTRALACVSKYSEDLFINAAPNSVTFSATNSSLSAHCRFTYHRPFFTKFNVRDRGMSVGDGIRDLDEQSQTIIGQLCVQPLLAILKHKNLEKSLEILDLIVMDGVFNHEDEDLDGLEGRLVVRLHCKHGIVKTHRLALQTPSSQMHLHVPEAVNESHVVIGPKAMRDMIDHFPSTRGKADPQIIWVFDDTEVYVRSFDNTIDGKGSGELATELTISADEFESYDIFAAPISFAFHLREFNATIAYAESMEALLDVRFTDPGAALYVNVQSDSIESLFAMSTNRVPGAPTSHVAAVPSQARSAGSSESAQDRISHKRPREETAGPHRTSAKVVERIVSPAFIRRSAGAPPPPPSLHAQAVRRHPEEPLFLPGSQMSAADREALYASGLGDMDADEFNAMMEDEGEEVGHILDPSDVPGPSVRPPQPQPPAPDLDKGKRGHSQNANFSEEDIEEMGPTQSDESSRAFRPLFDD